MKIKYLKIIFFVSTIALSHCDDKIKKQHSLNIESDGAWLLYSMNLYSGDSTDFKNTYPDKKYLEILSMDIIPIRRDTMYDKKIIYGYSYFNDGKVSSKNLLEYHSVEFDSNKIKKVFISDLIELNIDSNMVVYYDSLLLSLINNNKNIKLSKTLMEAYQNRVHNFRRAMVFSLSVGRSQ